MEGIPKKINREWLFSPHVEKKMLMLRSQPSTGVSCKKRCALIYSNDKEQSSLKHFKFSEKLSEKLLFLIICWPASIALI